jgi:protein-L-isoaspartate(D-aspartate) O-methyltransferase
VNKDELIASLRKKGFSESIVKAFEKVKREDFVPEHLIGYAYEDMALPVMDGSTLSQPSTVAFMLDLLDVKEGQKIVEIGSGSGYVLALLAEMNQSGKIYGVEILKDLAVKSMKYLESRKNVEVVIRNGSNGLPELAPYDRIIISASCPEVPRHLLSQLNDSGVLVAAVKQSIFQIKKSSEGITEKEYPGFVFVPLVS